MADLSDVLRDEIEQQGSITFARFMAVALYHPVLGYYAGGGAGREPIGWQGDYFTSGDLHPLWGECIARQFVQMWELLGQPARFDVIELGAGRGLLPCEVWRYALARAPKFAAALHYTLADRAPHASPLRVARAARLVQALEAVGAPTDATTWAESLDDALPGQRAITGCVFSNELVDALPVHIVEKRDGELAEVYISLDEQRARFVEVLGPPSSPQVAGYLDAYRIPWRTYPDGWRAEICLEARGWMRRVAAAVRCGFVLTIDYGATARQLYTRDRRHGTLAVYTRHQLGERPLAHPGQQDLTAHVNFTALVEEGRAAGLRLAGLTTQAKFLTRLGIREEMEALAARLYPAADTARATNRGQADYLRRASLRNSIAALLDPRGLGGFRVLIQQRSAPGAKHALLGMQE